MSIVVTCSCTMTYRLPDRYAGKRCRCRECGGRIRVPEEEAEARPRRRQRARGAAAGGEDEGVRTKRVRRKKRERRGEGERSTRRLNSQEQEILRERRALQGDQPPRRPVSESMHQLAPLNLSGTVERPESYGPPARKGGAVRRSDRRRRSTKRAERTRRRERDEVEVREPRERKRRKRERPAEPPEGKAKKGKKKKARSRADEPAPKKKGRGEAKAPRAGRGLKGKAPLKGLARGGAAKVGPAKGALARPAKGALARKKDKAKGASKLAGRKSATLGVRGRRSGEEEAAPTRGSARRSPVRLALIAAGVLTLLIGLAVGLAMQGGGPGAGSGTVDQKLAYVAELKANRQWDAARSELQALKTKLEAAGDAAAAVRVQNELVPVDMMVQLATIEDDYTRLETLIDYADYQDATVRVGVAMELRALGSQFEAQEALAALAADADPTVAEAAKQSLIAVGGPHSIPYLQQAIEESAPTGGKLGEVALQRALELFEPEVVPVLIKALEVRSAAPAEVLRGILDHLHELGDPRAVEPARAFVAHDDEGVRAAAQRVVDDLS